MKNKQGFVLYFCHFQVANSSGHDNYMSVYCTCLFTTLVKEQIQFFTLETFLTLSIAGP